MAKPMCKNPRRQPVASDLSQRLFSLTLGLRPQVTKLLRQQGLNDILRKRVDSDSPV
jgi:hypothetical protein